MDNIKNLYKIIEDERIILDYEYLGEKAGGYYEYDGDKHFIFINSVIVDDTSIHQSILAEELGHYYTSVGDNTPARSSPYFDRVYIEKTELYAARWAADYLMPTKEVLEYAKEKKFSNYRELGDLFSVTETLAKVKLEHMAAIKSYWSLDNGYDLILTNLPSLYLFKSMKL